MLLKYVLRLFALSINAVAFLCAHSRNMAVYFYGHIFALFLISLLRSEVTHLDENGKV